MPATISGGGANLLPLENRQCILAAPHSLFRIPTASHIVWFDTLQLHGLPQPAGTTRPADMGAPRHINVGSLSAMVFATRMVLQGVPQGSHAAAVWDSSSAMHFESMHLLDFGCLQPTIPLSLYCSVTVLLLVSGICTRHMIHMNTKRVAAPDCNSSMHAYTCNHTRPPIGTYFGLTMLRSHTL